MHLFEIVDLYVLLHDPAAEDHCAKSFRRVIWLCVFSFGFLRWSPSMPISRGAAHYFVDVSSRSLFFLCARPSEYRLRLFAALRRYTEGVSFKSSRQWSLCVFSTVCIRVWTPQQPCRYRLRTIWGIELTFIGKATRSPNNTTMCWMSCPCTQRPRQCLRI